MIARLKKRSEFLRIARTQNKWVTPGLIMQVRHHSPQEKAETAKQPICVGFTVSRKVGNAVQRNRAKRRLRAVTDELLAQHVKPGNDIVIIGRRATIARPFGLLKADFEKALKKLSIYQDATPQACEQSV
ncbi:MAG: ribonuclease P protein component [Rhodospirillales bacterium]|jgi:ribonuclease P protein component